MKPWKVNKCSYQGICFKKDYYVAQYDNDIIIYVILTVVKTGNSVYLFCQKLENINYDPHYLAYEISANALGGFFLLKFDHIIGPSLNIVNTASGKK